MWNIIYMIYVCGRERQDEIGPSSLPYPQLSTTTNPGMMNQEIPGRHWEKAKGRVDLRLESSTALGLSPHPVEEGYHA